MKGIFFLLFASIIAFQKESTASPLLKELLGEDEKKLELYKKACATAAEAIKSYYSEKHTTIKVALIANKDCELDIMWTQLTALTESIKQLQKDFRGEAKSFIANSDITVRKIENDLKALEESISKKPDCDLKVVSKALVQIKSKCNFVRNKHRVVCEAYLKDSPSLLKIVDDLLEQVNV